MPVLEEQVLIGFGKAQTVKSVHIEPSMLGGDILHRIHKALERSTSDAEQHRRKMAPVNGPLDIQLAMYLESYGVNAEAGELHVGEITSSEDGLGVVMRLEDDIMATIVPKLVNNGVEVIFVHVSCNPKGFTSTSTRREANLSMVFDAFCTSRSDGYFD